MIRNKLTALLLAAGLILGGMAISANAMHHESGEKKEAHAEMDHNGMKMAPDFKGQVVVLEWINYGCPYVQKHYGSGNMQALQNKYADKVAWLSINSSAEGKQGHYTMEEIADVNEEHNHSAMHYLMDPSGEIGKSYDAKTTPHMFVIDEEGHIIYEGAIDSIPSADKADIEKAENYVEAALEAHMNGEKVATPKTQPYGCGVKY